MQGHRHQYEQTGSNHQNAGYYLGSSAPSKTCIDRQQKLRREGDTVTLSIRQVLDTVPDDLKVYPGTRFMDVRSRYDCKKQTVSHLSSLELSADNEYLGSEPKPLDRVPVHAGTLNAAVMDVACSAGRARAKPQRCAAICCATPFNIRSTPAMKSARSSW